MGRFHRHADGTVHEHHHHHDHDHGPVTIHSYTEREELGDHSGYETGEQRIMVLEDIFSENDRLASANRASLDGAGVFCVNLMSSPGSGKTELMRRLLEQLADKERIGIIEGDIETSLDADRLDGFGAQISLLNTGHGFGGECHLDAPMVANALGRLNLADLDLVLIENVGNLVCPAEFETGAHTKAMVFSITEGEDKPLKYPVMFASVEAVFINKMDLADYLDFDMDLFLRNLKQVNPTAEVFFLSAKTGDGVDKVVAWLTHERDHALGRAHSHSPEPADMEA
ncbi:MAG: hydrogenase nickel incorporation protein HypB [Corynebacterium sp.]|nr:hydrogenase nickel incorporation protein HypB [Corynebacterium sp.]